MDFEFYRNFITVAETGNLTAASRKLSLAQPALSAQLRTLENHYGTQLIKKGRGRRHIVLTEAGTAFLQKAQQLCNTEDGIVLDMQSFARQAAGTVRFSVSYVATRRLLEDYLLPFAEAYPRVTFQIREEAVSQQVSSLRTGMSDFAFANAPLADRQNFNFRQIRQERFVAAFFKQKFAAKIKGKSVSLATIGHLPVACNYGCYKLLRDLFSKEGIDPEIRFVATTGTAAMRFAAKGAAVAIISEDCARDLPEGMEKISIQDEELFFEQTFYWLKEAAVSPAAQLFLRYCGFSTD